jgi:hypothetical protein
MVGPTSAGVFQRDYELLVMSFFILQAHPYVHNVAAATDFLPLEESRGEAPRCVACRKYVGMLPLKPPIRVELETWTDQFGDLAFGPADELLVGDRF